MRNALGALIQSLDGVRDVANDVAANTAAALADPKIRMRHETQECGAVVLLTGYFEAFLKETIRAFIDQVSGLRIAFASLPDCIRQNHFEGGGRILAEVARRTRRGLSLAFSPASNEDVVQRLDSVRANPAGGYVVLWEAFADTRESPRASVVAEVLRGVDIAGVWPAIAAKTGTGESTLIAKLDNLILVRNECAHTGTVSPIPGPPDLLDYCDALETIATGIVGILEDRLAAYTPPAVPAP